MDDKRDVALAIDEEVQRRAAQVPLPLGAYIGPSALLMVPTALAGREMEPMEHYRRGIHERPRGCLQLASNLEEVVDKILVHKQVNQCWKQCWQSSAP